jgi:hypothetical protein
MILGFLHECGARGATYTEIMDGTKLTSGSVCARLIELATADRVRKNGTRPTPSGRAAKVYVLPQHTPGIAS